MALKTYTSEAIKLAIEKGGYTPKEYVERNYFASKKGTRLQSTGANPSESEIVTDPLFWQALGKALEWEIGTKVDGNGDTYEWPCEWLYRALRYHELKLIGGNEETFWQELLSKNDHENPTSQTTH